MRALLDPKMFQFHCSIIITRQVIFLSRCFFLAVCNIFYFVKKMISILILSTSADIQWRKCCYLSVHKAKGKAEYFLMLQFTHEYRIKGEDKASRIKYQSLTHSICFSVVSVTILECVFVRRQLGRNWLKREQRRQENELGANLFFFYYFICLAFLATFTIKLYVICR